MSRQSKFDARYWMLGAGALGRPRGMVWGGRREEGSGWGTCVCLWRIHFNIWQNQYNIVKFKNKIKLKKKKKKESCSLKNWCFWTVVLKNTESPLDCKEIQPVHPKGDLSWVFIGRTNAKAETPVLWPPHVKSWLIGKDPDAGRDWGHEKKGMTEDEMAGRHHRLDGRESEWTPGVGDGQGGLACCNSWGYKELDTTAWLNWTELNYLSNE